MKTGSTWAQSRGPIISHFDPDLMQTQQTVSHANIWEAIWRTKRPPSCLSLGWGELVSRIESNLPFCACVRPYAYELVKTLSKNLALACMVCAWRGLGRVKKLANSWPARPHQRSQDAFRLASCVFSYAHSLSKASTNSVYSHWLFTCNSSGTMGTTTSTPFVS